VPSEGNVLVDMLLARGINGESPVKKRAPRKKPSVTPKTRTPSMTIVSRVLGSTTPRTDAPKRTSRKSAAAPSDVDENKHPPPKKRSKRTKSADGRRTPGAPLRQVAVGSLH
jgi:hypothetical protein